MKSFSELWESVVVFWKKNTHTQTQRGNAVGVISVVSMVSVTLMLALYVILFPVISSIKG